MCIFILAGDIHCGYRPPLPTTTTTIHKARGISQTSRGIKWWEWEDEREHCLLFSSLGTEQNRLREDTCYPLTASNTASGPPLLIWCSWELCCAEWDGIFATHYWVSDGIPTTLLLQEQHFHFVRCWHNWCCNLDECLIMVFFARFRLDFFPLYSIMTH